MTSLPERPASPDTPAPPMRPDAIRRTSSIDVHWPKGHGTPAFMIGRARDLILGAAPKEAGFQAIVDTTRRITAIGPDVRLKRLIGERAGGKLRSAIAEAVPEEIKAGSALHLLLDDISGAHLVSSWAWSLWNEDWIETLKAMKADPGFSQKFARENVCAGLRTGSSGLSLDAPSVETADLRNPDDPEGWHKFPEFKGCAFRRARRIDVWIDQLVCIDAHFQDSATTPAGARAAVHEYRIRASADPETLTLLSLENEARVLPFPECPVAATNAQRLTGTPLYQLRSRVLEDLKGPVGCTHLNDALRALADVPLLLAALRG